jgi:hypothetical protein
MDISNLKKSTDKVEGGEWVWDIPQMGELKLRVRGLGSEVYKQLFARKQRAVVKADRERDGSIKEEVLFRIRGEALHETILLEWDGLSEGGKPYPFDKDVALTWLTSPEYEDFHFATLYAAGVVGKERAERTADLAKNSRSSSDGK